ncbi:hypothetical protein [Janthinobacterium sp. NKUCC06_STL]|uniref:hypothetical protein n=1 Tax=Janthinobacterium sp. NKUCC06_STL TaxID=2842127 RepID=UPI001C5AEA66|nr:hypothetical protein [Janthinobacterium sp. NKUCC06_STL]MBW3512043.1 hypothetical protein [Janthinobacterium sp. NKUCC06_STL]
MKIQENYIEALRRFRECCEDPDSGGHDVPKDEIRQLVEIGLLRSIGFGRHITTAFADWLLPDSYAEPRQLPSAAASQVVADERAARIESALARLLASDPTTAACSEDDLFAAVNDESAPPFVREQAAAMLVARAALAATPMQAQDPVACGCNGVGGCVTSVELPAGKFCKASCFSAAEQMAFRAPVQPVAVPDGWPTDEMVIRGAEQLQDCLRGAGVVHDFDADLKGTEIQQDIAESIFRSMLELAAPAAQGDSTDGAYEFAAKVIELFDDATMRADHMLDAGECASVIRALKSTEIAAIAAKAAS